MFGYELNWGVHPQKLCSVCLVNFRVYNLLKLDASDANCKSTIVLQELQDALQIVDTIHLHKSTPEVP